MNVVEGITEVEHAVDGESTVDWGADIKNFGNLANF